MHMRSKTWLSRLVGVNPEREGVIPASQLPLDARDLAERYGVSVPLMDEFMARFAPGRVAENRYKADADTMLFIHIPKTAGVSVGKSLQQGFDGFHGVQWDDVPRSFRQATRTATYVQSTERKRQVIMGHFGWPEMQVWRNHEMPLKCGTILRDPLARLVSNYNYNCSEVHPDNQRFKSKFPTLASYAEQMPFDPQLTQAIGLLDSFETALKKFVAHYTFLGVTERLSRSLRHLGRSHGLPSLPEYRENMGRSGADACVSPELQHLVERRSVNDLRMHRLVMELYDAEQ